MTIECPVQRTLCLKLVHLFIKANIIKLSTFVQQFSTVGSRAKFEQESIIKQNIKFVVKVLQILGAVSFVFTCVFMYLYVCVCNCWVRKKLACRTHARGHPFGVWRRL